MAMPTITVEMATPSGSTWRDITDWVDMRGGIGVRRGRNSEFDNISPGTASLVVDNSEGDFTPGGGSTIDGYGVLVKNAKIRMTVSGTRVFTGYVDSIVCDLKDQTATISCSDKFKHFANYKLGPYGVERAKRVMESTSYTSGAVYALTDARTGVGDEWAAWRDPGKSRIKRVNGSAGHGEFTSERAGAFLGGSFRIAPSTGLIGPVLEHPYSFTPGTSGGGTNGTISFWFRTSTEEDMVLFRMFRTSGGSGYMQGQINGLDGDLTFTAAGDSAGTWSHTTSRQGLFDDQWHHVLLLVTDNNSTSKTRIEVFLDGTSVHASDATDRMGINSSNRRMVFGGIRNNAWTDNSYCLRGYIAMPMVFNDGSASAASDIYTAATTGDSSSTVSTQLTRLAAFVGGSSWGLTDSPSGSLAGIDTANRSYLDCVGDIVSAILGTAFVDRNGNHQIVGHDARSSATVDLTLSASEDILDDLTLSLDDATFANTVEATSPAGTAVAEDATSVSAVGPIVDSFTCPLAVISTLEARADIRLDQRMTDTPRLSRVTVDMLAGTFGGSSTRSDVLTAEPMLTRVRITDLKSAVIGATTYDGFVEGWELKMSADSYTISLDLSPVI